MSDRIDVQVLLNSVDITDKVDLRANPVQITSALNEELDTLNLVVKDGDALAITGWQDIQVKNGTEIIFGGHVLMSNRAGGADAAKNDYEIGASDYGAYLDKVFVQDEFIEKTDAEIIAEIFAGSTDLAAYDGTTYVKTIRTIPRVVFNRISVRNVLNWLVQQSGGYWYPDYEKKVHYFGAAEFSAPFDVTNDPASTTKKTVENVQIDVDAAGVVNLVEVIGGMALQGDETFKFTQAGVREILQLNKRLAPWNNAAKIVVRRNDGGATTNLLVNPSFEVNITDGWTQAQAGAGAAWAQDSAKYNKGAKSVKITAGTQAAYLRGASITLDPGEPLSVQAMAWTAALGMASVVIYDVTGAVVLAETVNRETSKWELLTATYLNNSAASMTVRIELWNKATDSATITYFDGAQAELLSWPSAYCDGSLGTGYAWSGTANNSTSTRVNMPVWTTLTVKTGNRDTLGARNEVLYYDTDARLEQETYWPTLDNAIEVDGQEELPVRAVARNYASHTHYGKWFKTVITDPSIIDSTVARMRAATELVKNAYETESISYDVRTPGLRAGQTQHVYLPHRGINDYYLIRSVSTSIGVGGYAVSTVSLGAADASLVGLLLALKRAQSGVTDLAADEKLDSILDFYDSLTVEDDGATATGTSGPYSYDVAEWDYCKYADE